eukprot:gene1447-1660_t
MSTSDSDDSSFASRAKASKGSSTAPVLDLTSLYNTLMAIPAKGFFSTYDLNTRERTMVPEHALAVAYSACSILTIPSEEYQCIINDYKSALKEEVRGVLAHCNVFSNWPNNALNKLAASATLVSVEANTEILKAGETVKFLSIVKRGVVKLVKAIDKPQTNNIQVSEFARPDSTVGMEPPGLWVLEKNWKDSIDTFDHFRGTGKVEFTVGILGSGQVFGELSVLDPEQKSPFSVVTFTN